MPDKMKSGSKLAAHRLKSMEQAASKPEKATKASNSASAKTKSDSTNSSSDSGKSASSKSLSFRASRSRRLTTPAASVAASVPRRSSQRQSLAQEKEERDRLRAERNKTEDCAVSDSATYAQMPMRSFMSHKDWRELITRRSDGKLSKCKNSGNKYHRMLYSYHKLYQEYQYLCTCMLPRSGCAEASGHDGGGDGKANDEQQMVAVGSGTVGADDAAGPTAVTVTAAAATAAAAAASVDADASVFGSVLMSDRNFNVQRCKKRRTVVCHRVLTRCSDGATVWLNVPIAVELLLPRLQEQIKAVMNACPHLPDPLEILAELRINGYDTERCIEYLRETMPLRDVVRDILSVRSSGRLLNAAKAAADRRDLRCRITGLETQLRTAAAQLLLDGASCNAGTGGGHDGSGMGGSQSGGLSNACYNPISGRVRRLVASLGAIKTLLDVEDNPQHRKQRQQQRPQQSPILSSSGAWAVADACSGRPLLRGIHRLKEDMRIVRTSLQSLSAAMAVNLTKVGSHLNTLQERQRRSVKDGGAQTLTTVARLQRYIEELRVKCKEEEARRRLVFNALQEQLGNIRVYCRCTRINGDQVVETVGAESVRIRGQQQDEYFRFDRVFGPDAPQETLFDELQPLITSFLDGYSVCFLTYGGEASGKTFTLLGSSKQRGLVYRALLAILKEAGNRDSDWQMELDATCMEIYNDACFDLLADRSAVSLYQDCGLSSVFAALQLAPIREEQDVKELLRICSAKRRVAKTALNPKSSRSHLVNLIRLQAKSRVHGHTICSYMGMMDLAGAENIVKADTWREPDRTAEAGHINRSLAAFNRLFLTLRRTPPSAACYRESRLTQMLKPFLVNHGKCCVIVTVRTDLGSSSSTMSTLRFGRDARQVALGKAQRQLLNVDG